MTKGKLIYEMQNAPKSVCYRRHVRAAAEELLFHTEKQATDDALKVILCLPMRASLSMYEQAVIHAVNCFIDEAVEPTKETK